MSEEKFYCERCGKELVFRCGYSKIDHKLICVDCGNKEEPKELAKKISDLEAKLEENEKRYLKTFYEKNKTIIELEEENKRLSKNLRISWTKRMQFYNGLLINKLRDVRDRLDKELFDGYYEKDISVGSVKVVVGAVFDQQIKSLKGEK